ncbi:tRNA (adenosine(37)-N6)-threonylcarbamoyltransferase complex dimerization subunit type 1 TsaB [Rubrolithibacter danxiaensis]|uniref:tRNA (adenosine(37)-N6)-threonylcarbamoyltransferase complex dimerization subunit type 1 TsaB n=1 Tax=Rubrolithibacter danxiaensis TaxID=3390805 RepID=UPI003BF7E2EB
MSLILQLETSTSSCSVALSLEGKVIAFEERDEKNIHAAKITLFIEKVMADAAKSMNDLDAIAVSKGPGSYTGLRIGVSVAKGLCFALDIPLIAVDTLQSMTKGIIALNVYDQDTLFCPMIDARRMEVYTALYNSELEEILPVEAKIIDEHAFEEVLEKKPIVFFGDGASKCKAVLADNKNAHFYAEFSNSAKHMSAAAYSKFRSRQFEDTAYFEPFYLKDFLILPPKK